MAPVPCAEFEIKTLDGGELRSDELKNKWGIICIFTIWDPNCVREVPELKKMEQALKGLPVKIMAICIQDTPEADIQAFVKDQDIDCPIGLVKLEDIPGPFRGIDMLPTLFIVDPTFTVINRHNGFTPVEKIQYEILARIQQAKRDAEASKASK